MRIEGTVVRQITIQQIKEYKHNIDQTSKDGTLLCPNCGNRLSPDDNSKIAYTIHEAILKDNKLDAVVLYCKRCLSFIHLDGFFEIEKISQSINAEKKTRKDLLLYIDHI